MEEYIKGQLDQFLKDLETIVNIDSGSNHQPGLMAVASFFEKRFKKLGMTTTIIEAGECGVPCLNAFTPPKNNRFDVLMIGHMDTVFPQGESLKRPFTITGTRATGPGVCDMKGGLLTALYALEALKENGAMSDLAVCVFFNGDEEIGSPDTRSLIEEYSCRSDHVFVFESSRKNNQYVLERKGCGSITITGIGNAAHAGSAPEKGANAILEIAHQVVNLHALNCPEKGTSVQATIITGGHKVNIVADLAILSVDVRVKDMAQLRKINKFFENLPLKPYVNGVSLSVDGHVNRPPMTPNKSTMELWELIKTVATDINISPKYAPRGGASDGNYSAALGIPTIDGMGPSGDNAHTVNEYLDTTSIIPQTTIAALACKEIAKEGQGR